MIYKRAMSARGRGQPRSLPQASLRLLAAPSVCSAGYLGLFGLLIAPHLPQQPEMPAFAQTMTLATIGFFIAVSVFGICTGFGLLGRKNWARISALVWAGISAPFSALSVVVILLIPFPSSPSGPPTLRCSFISFLGRSTEFRLSLESGG